MIQSSPRICILGGGFGGLYTALRLSQFSWEGFTPPEIVLIDRQDRFLFAPFLYELVTEEMQTWEIAPPFTEILAETGVQFRQAEVTGIQPDQKTVTLNGTETLGYDYLVIALGGTQPAPTLPGVQDYALGFRTLQDAYELKQRLKQLEQSPADKIRVAIVGGGYSGVELAGKLGDRLGKRGRIRIVERGNTLLAQSPEANRRAAQTALKAKGIWVDLETTVTELTADTLTLAYQHQTDTLPVDLVIWTVGTAISPLIQALPFPKGDRQLLNITPQLLVEGETHIFALGDSAQGRDATGQQVPSTAQVAFQQADYCAWNLWATLTDRPLLPFRYQVLGEMLSLGINDGALTGLGLKLTGPAAALARRLVYLYRFPSWQQQLTVGINWIAQPFVQWLKRG